MFGKKSLIIEILEAKLKCEKEITQIHKDAAVDLKNLCEKLIANNKWLVALAGELESKLSKYEQPLGGCGNEAYRKYTIHLMEYVKTKVYERTATRSDWHTLRQYERAVKAGRF